MSIPMTETRDPSARIIEKTINQYFIYAPHGYSMLQLTATRSMAAIAKFRITNSTVCAFDMFMSSSSRSPRYGRPIILIAPPYGSYKCWIYYNCYCVPPVS